MAARDRRHLRTPDQPREWHEKSRWSDRPDFPGLPWIWRPFRRKYAAASLPPGSALSDPPENLDLDTAKAALEQINKRLDAQVATKVSTETRSLTLAGQCTTLLTAVVGATLVEAAGSARLPLLLAGGAAATCLFMAVLLAYTSIRPRRDLVLPGRLPDELWDDLVAPDMKGAEFMARLMQGVQDAMLRNERAQHRRAAALARAVFCVILAGPAALLGAVAPHLAAVMTHVWLMSPS